MMCPMGQAGSVFDTAQCGDSLMSRKFDNNEMQCVQSAIPRLEYPLTISAWVWINSAYPSQEMQIAGVYSTLYSLCGFYFIRRSGFDRLDLIATGRTAGPNGAIATLTDLPLDQWVMISAVGNSTTSRSIYLNGAFSNSSTAAVNSLGADFASIGNQYNGAIGSKQTVGNIAYMSAWQQALTNEDIAFLYNNGNGCDSRLLYPSKLLTYWPLVDNDYDQSLKQHHGTPIGNPNWESFDPPIYIPKQFRGVDLPPPRETVTPPVGTGRVVRLPRKRGMADIDWTNPINYDHEMNRGMVWNNWFANPGYHIYKSTPTGPGSPLLDGNPYGTIPSFGPRSGGMQGYWDTTTSYAQWGLDLGGLSAATLSGWMYVAPGTGSTRRYIVHSLYTTLSRTRISVSGSNWMQCVAVRQSGTQNMNFLGPTGLDQEGKWSFYTASFPASGLAVDIRATTNGVIRVTENAPADGTGTLNLTDRVEGCRYGASAFATIHNYAMPLEQQFDLYRLQNSDPGQLFNYRSSAKHFTFSAEAPPTETHKFQIFRPRIVRGLSC